LGLFYLRFTRCSRFLSFLGHFRWFVLFYKALDKKVGEVPFYCAKEGQPLLNSDLLPTMR
jgi:hypothetical protein